MKCNHEPGRHGLHSGRKLSSADLQLILLALLEKGPSYGYELIKSLEEISTGFYVPSPGMIYPSLTYLEELGFAEAGTLGTRKLYSLTSEGRNFIEKNRQPAQIILAELERIGSRMDDARRVLAGEKDFGETNSEQSEDLRRVRHELKTFLRGYESASEEDEHRIVQILEIAVSSIRNSSAPPSKPRLDEDALMEILSGRRSEGLSRLSPNPVDPKLVEKMLEAANWAPSHGDTEPWRFTVFTGDGREKLASIFGLAQPENADLEGARKRAFAAPVWISIGMSPGLNPDGSLLMSEEEEVMAVACAAQNLHLMAHAQGLTGMWHSKGSSVHPAVASGLGLEPPSRLLGFFMCGWPAGERLSGSRGPAMDKVTRIGGRS